MEISFSIVLSRGTLDLIVLLDLVYEALVCDLKRGFGAGIAVTSIWRL